MSLYSTSQGHLEDKELTNVCSIKTYTGSVLISQFQRRGGKMNIFYLISSFTLPFLAAFLAETRAQEVSLFEPREGNREIINEYCYSGNISKVNRINYNIKIICFCVVSKNRQHFLEEDSFFFNNERIACFAFV